jgi:hypothetical protein
MTDVKIDYEQKNSFWRRWGAVVILLVFFFASWGGQFVNQLRTEKLQAEQHHQEFKMADFWPQFWSSTFENWQSEWLQLTTQAVLISGLSSYVFRKQNEEHYKTQLMIAELQKKLAAKNQKK